MIQTEAFHVRTIIELPDSVYKRSEEIARQNGFSVEQLIVRALERELAIEPAAFQNPRRLTLPLIASKRPGVMNLADFDFDDLFA
jgi:hypothetical protein